MGQKGAVACSIYVSNSHTKFSWISSYDLGDDIIKDRRTDEGDHNSPNTFLKSVGIINLKGYKVESMGYIERKTLKNLSFSVSLALKC